MQQSKLDLIPETQFYLRTCIVFDIRRWIRLVYTTFEMGGLLVTSITLRQFNLLPGYQVECSWFSSRREVTSVLGPQVEPNVHISLSPLLIRKGLGPKCQLGVVLERKLLGVLPSLPTWGFQSAQSMAPFHVNRLSHVT